jgi:HAD superfamily hydrolase (TIGR01549 family)
MNSNIKTIIFDYGGTLDTDGVHWSEKFREAYQHFQFNIDEKIFKDAFVYSERNISDVIKPDFSLKQTYETQIKYQLKYLEKFNIVNGNHYVIIDKITSYCLKSVLETVKGSKIILDQLEPEFELGLISNYYGNVETVLNEMDLRKYFKVVLDSAVVGFRKPDIKIFKLALEKLNTNAADTVVVGDSYGNDIAPSKQAGCITVWLKRKSWDTPIDVNGADVTINSVKDLPYILKSSL